MGKLLSDYKKKLDEYMGVTTRESTKTPPIVEVTQDRYDRAMKSLAGYTGTRLVSAPVAVTVLQNLGVPDAEKAYNTSPIKKAKTIDDLRNFIEQSYTSKKVDMFSDA